MSRHELQFAVRHAQTDADLRAACAVRATAYGRHLPNVTSLWSEPDALDRSPDSAVFVAFCKRTGEAVGTIRLTTNARQPTQIEQSTALPRRRSANAPSPSSRASPCAPAMPTPA